MSKNIIQINRKDFNKWTTKKLKETYCTGTRGIILNAMGTDLFPIKKAKKIGYNVKSLPDYCSNEVARHAFTLENNLIKTTHTINTWQKKHLIIGSKGNIGSKVLERLLYYEIPCIEHDPKAGHTKKDLNEKLKTAEIILTCIPLTKETKEIYDKKFFDECKAKPLIINVSGRNQLFKLTDLATALDNKTISGYASDEYTKYKHLLNNENVYLTDHVGWYSPNAVQKRNFLLKEIMKNMQIELNKTKNNK